MNYRSFLIGIFCVCCTLPALMVPREVEFEHVEVAEGLTLTGVPEGDAGSMVSIGDRVIGVDGRPVSSIEELEVAVARSPRLVPVRVLRGTPLSYEWNPGASGEAVPRLIESGKRIVSLGRNSVFDSLTVAEATDQATAVAVDAGSVTVELADPEQVVDGAFVRTYGGPSDIELIVAAAALGLLVLTIWLLRRARTLTTFAVGLLLTSSPYFARYLFVSPSEWLLYSAVTCAGVGVIAMVVSLAPGRSRNQKKASFSSGRISRTAGASLSEAVDPTHRVAFALQRLSEHVGEGSVPEFVVGFNRRSVRIRRVAAQLRVQLAEQPLHAGLAMLAIEGGVLPRTETIIGMESIEPEDDPFTGLQRGLNIRAAVPLSEIGDASRSWAFAVVYDDSAKPETSEQDGPVDLIPLADLLEDLRGPMLATELKSLAADELLSELERADEKTSRGPHRKVRGSKVVTNAPQPPPPASTARTAAAPARPSNDARSSLTRTGRRSDDDDAYLNQLSDELQREYHLSDPAVLTPELWAELDVLISDDARPYLIVGEPGVGKELRARLIHLHSPRAKRRMAVVECAGAPESVVTARLLGSKDSEGVVASVSGGTLILKSALELGQVSRDEIVARCASHDVRLAFVERRTVESRRLPAEIPTSMRQVIGSRWMTVQALHEMPGEALRVADRFLHESSLRYGRRVLSFSERAAEVIGQMEFAANFHELRVICLAAVLTSDSEVVEVEQLKSATTGDVADVLAEVEADEEKRQIVEALHRADGNKSEASRMLGMSRGTLLRRLKQYKLV